MVVERVMHGRLSGPSSRNPNVHFLLRNLPRLELIQPPGSVFLII